jgi:hypothetical protein
MHAGKLTMRPASAFRATIVSGGISWQRAFCKLKVAKKIRPPQPTGLPDAFISNAVAIAFRFRQTPVSIWHLRIVSG